jgi:cobalt-zinc-cadmium efflux system outer membrane protein
MGLGVGLALVCSMSVGATAGASEALTLAEARARALTHNSELRAADAAAGPVQTHETGVDTIPAGARVQTGSTDMEVDTAVVKAYLCALVADENFRIARAAAHSLARAAATPRPDADEIYDLETALLAIAAESFRAELEAARVAELHSGAALQALVGVSHPDGKLVLADDLWTLPRSLLATTKALLDIPPERAAESRSDVKAARLALLKAEETLKLHWAERVRDPLSAEGARPSGRSQTVRFGVRPPPAAFSPSGDAGAAEIAVTTARREMERVLSNAVARIGAARAALHLVLLRHSIVHDSVMPHVEDMRMTTLGAYRRGGASVLELLDAELTYDELRRMDVSSQAEVLTDAVELAVAMEMTSPSNRP